MTAHLPHAPPTTDVDALLHDLLETEELWPAVERRLLAQPDKAPAWAKERALGPWTRLTQDGEAWSRFSAAHGFARLSVWWSEEGWWWNTPGSSRQGPYIRRNQAMGAADEEMAGGWAFDPSLPPEEEPAPAPQPQPQPQCRWCGGTGVDPTFGSSSCQECNGTGREPAPVPVPAEEGEGVRAQARRRTGRREDSRHTWVSISGNLFRCVRLGCGRYKWGSSTYVTAASPEDAMRLFREDTGHDTRAGGCILSNGRRAP